MTLFRHPADRKPVAFILGLTALDFVVYFAVDSLWFFVPYFVFTLIFKGCICAWNHHHQHTMTFRQKPLNRLSVAE